MTETTSGTLLRPGPEHLATYDAALARGWSPNTLRPEAAEEERTRIVDDPDGLLGSFDDPDAAEGDVNMPDGSTVPRLPSIRRFIWDGEFCGSISLRWTKDGGPLPPTCLGHVGYTVVPWKRRRGLATQALREICVLAKDYGLDKVEVTVSVDNPISQRVIEKAGGVHVKDFMPPASLKTGLTRLYVIG